MFIGLIPAFAGMTVGFDKSNPYSFVCKIWNAGDGGDDGDGEFGRSILDFLSKLVEKKIVFKKATSQKEVAARVRIHFIFESSYH